MLRLLAITFWLSSFLGIIAHPAVSQAKAYSVVSENPAAGTREIFAGDHGFSFAAQYRITKNRPVLALSLISTKQIDIMGDYSVSPAKLRVNLRTKNGTLITHYKLISNKWKSTFIGFHKHQTYYADLEADFQKGCDDPPNTLPLPAFVPDVAFRLTEELGKNIFDQSCKADPEIFRKLSSGINLLLLETPGDLLKVGKPSLLKCVLNEDPKSADIGALAFRAHRESINQDVPAVKIACKLNQPGKCASIDEAESSKTPGVNRVFQFNPSCFSDAAVATSKYPDAESLAKNLYIHEFLHGPPLMVPEETIRKLEESSCSSGASQHIFLTPEHQQMVVKEAIASKQLEQFPGDLADNRLYMENFNLKAVSDENHGSSRWSYPRLNGRV